ncbi:hypothetical protein PMAYCL1PPCAC_04176, partial [Pristionchus mayeri]
DRQQAAQQAQQLMMQQQQQYAAYAQNQHWQQPTQNMGYATYGMATAEYDKPANGEVAGYTYAAVDPGEYYAQRAAAAQQQQYMQQFSNPMFAAQQQQQYAVASYGQMADRGSAANFNPGAPPPQSQGGYARPPPAVKRAGEAGETGIHGSPLSVFENQQSSAAYTASWVSSTSSLPPDMKESPEDAHLVYHHQSHSARGTVPGNEWVQPGGGGVAAVAAAAADYGGTWGERRDENMFAAAAGGGGGATPFDHTQFARMNIDESAAAAAVAAHNHHHQQQSYSSAALGNANAGGMTSTGGEWNSPEKNHPQQGIKFQTNAWQTNNLNQGQAPPQPLMMLPPQPMNQHQQQQNAHQKGGKPMGGFSPMGGKGPQQQGGGPRGDSYGKDAGGNTVLSWEERLRKAQGAKERAEGGRQFGSSADANGGANGGGAAAGGGPREGGAPRGGRGGSGGGGRGRGRGGERSYGDRGGEGAAEHRGGGGGWKGGPPPEAVVQAQQGGDAGAFPMMPFGMQGMQGGGGGWRGNMRGGGGNGGYMRGGNGHGLPTMQMQMRGAAAAAARGAPHPMMMRGPMGGGFPMMAPGPGPMGVGSPMAQQDERFRSTWLDASMCLPTLMGIPGPMMNPMMGGGGFARGGPRGRFSSSPRGGRGGRGGGGGGGFRGGRSPYNRDRESPRQYPHRPLAEDTLVDGETKEEERTPVDSPVEQQEEAAAAAAVSEEQQEE